MNRHFTHSFSFKAALLAVWALLAGFASAEDKSPWWNKAWTVRKQITIDAAAAITEPAGAAPVLLRLHDGTYQFLAGKDDGSDMRFVAADGKTVLPHHVEKFDSLMNEGFVWVKPGEIKPGEKTTFWLYYGNTADAPKAEDAKATYDGETSLVYHFAERGTPATDASGHAITAGNAGLAVDGAQIGGGLRFDGKNSVTIPAAPAFAWPAGGKLTWSAWVKPATLQPGAVIFSRRDSGNGIAIGLDNGAPFIEVNGQRSAPGTPLIAGAWKHLAVVCDGAKWTVYLDGESSATLGAAMPALSSPALLGRDGTPDAPVEGSGFSGEIDELQISQTARPASFVKFSALSQGSGEQAGKLVVLAADEGTEHGGGSAALEHVMLFGDIAKNMMFDGWIAVGVCVLMMLFGWTVAVQKFNYLNSIQKGSELFLAQWKHLSSDLTALDPDDEESVKTFGGRELGAKMLRNLHRSPLYHLYQIGSEEIRHRVGGQDRSKGLSARSIQAIRASLESGLVHENHRMHKGLIFLTISIAGGPYVGLLGTVVGVMITFAIIAKSGEVDVNSIAPGIASALLATVFGLFVAIPALFIYSYLSSRIKDLLASMQVFIDEFIAKMAEFYPTPADGPAAHLSRDSSPPSRQAALEASASENHAS